MRPPRPKPVEKWDPFTLFPKILEWGKSEDLSLPRLASKLAFLLLMSTGCRLSELSNIHLDYIHRSREKWSFRLFNPAKNFNINNMDESLQMLDIQRNPYDQELCPIYSCSTYIDRTSSMKNTKYLFCTATHPYQKMSSQRLSNLVRKIFIENGILPSKSRRIQSARSVVSSYLFNAGVPLDQVLATGRWRSGAAFFKHYYKKPANMSTHQF